MRPFDHHGGNNGGIGGGGIGGGGIGSGGISGGRFNQLHDMNRQTHFDIGGGGSGGRDPPLDYGFRGYAQKPNPVQLQPQLQQQQQPIQSHQPQQPQQPANGYEGGRANAFGYNPYGHYAYNPYYRPGYYGWNRPAQTADPWRGTSSFGLGFPFNLLGLGGGRPWWSPNRFGLFF